MIGKALISALIVAVTDRNWEFNYVMPQRHNRCEDGITFMDDDVNKEYDSHRRRFESENLRGRAIWER